MDEREHNLKTWPDSFAAMWIGTKTAEYRLTDRDFRVGDTLVLSEWEPEEEEYTGRSIISTITHIAWPNDGFGIPLNYAMLSIRTDKHCEE